MSGVIVVDAESFRSTCHGRDAIYMIMPRYSHNYAQFCQLLYSNLFTHRRILMLLREATSETYGPRVYSHHINLHHFYIVLLFTFLYFLLCIFT